MKTVEGEFEEYNVKASNEFDFTVIPQYNDYLYKSNPSNYLAKRIQKDLELNKFFKYIDRTHSAIGQQYLYDKILKANNTKDSIAKLEQCIEYYSSSESQKREMSKILAKLSRDRDFYFPYLIFSELPSKMKYFSAVRVLQFLVIALSALVVFYNILFIPLVAIFALNLGIHYWHKNQAGNLIQYFFRINVLTSTCRKLDSKSKSKSKEKNDPIMGTIKRVEKLSTSISYLKTDSLQDSEIGAMVWYALEIIKIATLSEVILFQKVIDHIKERRDDIHTLYKYVGEIDAAISISLLRDGLDSYCKPVFVEHKKDMFFAELYHPLINACVANDLHLVNKSLLLTGSNMSGKSTFIKSIGLNVIASQTLNTSFTSQYTAPMLALSTSIKIDDDLSENKSYYQEEVITIGNMLDQSKNENKQYLFIIDEVFKGTNTIERISGGKAILSYLNMKDHIVLVATHDIELTRLLSQEYESYYFQESVDESSLNFDYKLRKGEIKKLNAIKIMEISGYPISIVNEARELAEKLEKEKTGMPLNG